jgi:2-polyprenyl-3-methyl-5-hydroxy-6-metoxy-1,4-benzoquinol methylase
MPEDLRDTFDAGLIPGMRNRLAEGYARFRAVEARGIPATAPPWAGGTTGAYQERDCPACGTPPPDRAELSAHGIDVVTCPACRLTYARQVLDQAADAARYEASAIDEAMINLRCSAPYLELESARSAYYVSRLSEGLAERGSLLEIGCGTGTFMVAARQAGWNVLGIEPGRAAAAIARGKGLDILDGYFPEVLGSQRTFDVIAMLDVLEHFADPLSFLAKASDHLEPGGHLFIQVPNWDSLLVRLDGAKSTVVCPGHWSYFTPVTLRDVLARAGFAALRIETVVSELDRINAHSPERRRAVLAELRAEAADWPVDALRAAQLHDLRPELQADRRLRARCLNSAGEGEKAVWRALRPKAERRGQRHRREIVRETVPDRFEGVLQTSCDEVRSGRCAQPFTP